MDQCVRWLMLLSPAFSRVRSDLELRIKPLRANEDPPEVLRGQPVRWLESAATSILDIVSENPVVINACGKAPKWNFNQKYIFF